MSEGTPIHADEHVPELAGEPGVPDLSPDLSSPLEGEAREVITPCSFLTGRAGTGKTYTIRERIAQDPSWGVLAATTGIAAVNLDAVTINSLLGYYDTDSLRDLYLQGRLTAALHKLIPQYRNLVIDENSMQPREQLEIIVRALGEANRYKDVSVPMGLMLVGDFAQLPPVRADWAFEAECWPKFAASTTSLTKVWRQEQLTFLDALQAARCGNGSLAVEILTAAGVQWHTSLTLDFDGTTIVPKNDQVDRYNAEALSKVRSPKITARSRRWGKARGEWKNIPEASEFKLGAYVMILSNQWDKDKDERIAFANGDCGHIVEYDGFSFDIQLVRNGNVVTVPRLVRDVSYKDKPHDWRPCDGATKYDGYHPFAHVDPKSRRYVVGQIEYFPLRLAYASTVHKSQGLSLDRVQVDIRNSFFKSPAMIYVALSRCRTLEGLRIVGQRERFETHCKCDPKVTRWL